MQCEDAPCINACGNNAISLGSDGIVRIDNSRCDGDGNCEKACPYAAIGPVADGGCDKCDFCSHRLDAGMDPACVETCPTDVFHFGDANDPASPYSVFMSKHGKEAVPLKPEENTHPAVVYRGHNKAMEQKIPKGKAHDPYSYEIETWASLEPVFPSEKRVKWRRPA